MFKKIKRWFRLKIKAIYYPEDLYKYWAAVCPECGYKCLSNECMGGMPNMSGDYDDVICSECFTPVDEDNDYIVIE